MKHSPADGLIGIIPHEMLENAGVTAVKAGACLIHAGQPIEHFYLLSSGTLKLLYEDSSSFPLIIDLYHAGDFFGEMEMMGIAATDRSLVAITDCGLYKFSREQFFNMWNLCRGFSEYVFRVHCQRLLRSGNEKIDAERMLLRDKVLKLIQDNAGGQGYFLYTKDVMAEMSGVSIRSLNRALAELEDRGLIKISSGTIRLNQ